MFPTNLLNGLQSTNSVFANPPTADLLDISGSGTIQGARYINLQTGDYAVDANGHFVGMDAVEQQVQFILFTTFGSAASPIGQTLLSIKLITTNIQGQVQSAVQSALANLINNGSITLSSVIVNKKPGGQVSLVVNFINNVSKQTLQTNTPIFLGT